MKEVKERNSYWNSGKWIDEVSIIGILVIYQLNA